MSIENTEHISDVMIASNWVCYLKHEKRKVPDHFVSKIFSPRATRTSVWSQLYPTVYIFWVTMFAT